MSGQLETIEESEVADFAAQAANFDGQKVEKDGPCLIREKNRCPDQQLQRPNCALCMHAISDQSHMITIFERGGFTLTEKPHAYVPEFYDNQRLVTNLTHGSDELTLENGNSRVNLTLAR